MSGTASQITRLTVVCWTVYSRLRSQKTSKLRVTGLCERNSTVTGEFPHKGLMTRKKFPFDDVTMFFINKVVVNFVFDQVLPGHITIRRCSLIHNAHAPGTDFQYKGDRLSPSGAARIRSQASMGSLLQHTECPPPPPQAVRTVLDWHLKSLAVILRNSVIVELYGYQFFGVWKHT